MSVAFIVNSESGDYVKATVVPANHSEQSRFGLMDSAVVVFFLLCVSSLVYLLLS